MTKTELKDQESVANGDKRIGQEERKTPVADNKHSKLVGKRSYEDICRSYENMFAFDWELKDINNLRHPPSK